MPCFSGWDGVDLKGGSRGEGSEVFGGDVAEGGVEEVEVHGGTRLVSVVENGWRKRDGENE